MTGFLDRIDYPKVIKILILTAYPAGLLGMAAFAYQVGPIYLFPYRVLIPFIWLVLILWAVSKRGILDLPPLQIKTFGFFLLIWLVYSFLSINWAVDQMSALKQVIFLFTSFSLIFFTVVFFDTADDLCFVSKIWMVFLGLTFILGFYETISGYHLPVSSLLRTDTERLRFVPTAVFYNQNDFATFLSLSAPFLLSAFLFAKKWGIRSICLVSFGVLLYLLIATDSRANYLAVFLEIIFFMIVAYSIPKNRRELFTVISSTLAILVFFPRRILEQLNAAIIYVQALALGASRGVGSLGVRLNLARNGLQFLLSTWGFGVGGGNVEGWMQTRAQFDTGNMTNIHNWFLEVLVNYGIFIFAGYVIFYLALIYKIYGVLRIHKNDHQMKYLGVALLGSLIGFLFASMSSSSIIALKPHWMIFALGLSYINIGMNKARREGQRTGSQADLIPKATS